MLRFGTMGFAYPDWVGPFYPPGTRSADYLHHYARCFDTLELDTTFYAHPAPERVLSWAQRVPDGFCFCAKAPRTITHEGHLERRADELLRFIEAMSLMGGKLGVILLQLPPSATIDQFEGLDQLLRACARQIPLAVEFRHSSWGQQRTLDLLRMNDCALVAAEYLTRPARLYVTADFLYLRLIGQHDRFNYLGREQIDVTPSLEWWRDQVRRVAPETAAWAGDGNCAAPVQDGGRVRRGFIFFNNDFAGFSVATCRHFMEMMGHRPGDLPPQPPEEPTLFPASSPLPPRQSAGASPRP